MAWLFVKRDTLEARARENERKKQNKTHNSLLLDFSSESEIMYIFMHKMHWCNAFFFTVFFFFKLSLRIHTNSFAKKNSELKRVLSCFIVCVHHW
jgi:hypothetical protein